MKEEKDPQNAILLDGRSAGGICRGDRYPTVRGRYCVLLSSARKSCKQTHYRRCGRCGRYFTALIKYILLLVVTFLPTRAHQSVFKRLCNRGTDSLRPLGPNEIIRVRKPLVCPSRPGRSGSSSEPGVEPPGTLPLADPFRCSLGGSCGGKKP